MGDLSQILDERIYAQTQSVLDSLKEDLGTFVITDGYRAAISALEEHGFVLLIGEPGAGKTVTAATIAAAASDLWGLRVAQIDDPSAIRHWNPDEPQLLWADDAFGVMNLNPAVMDPWNRSLSLVRPAYLLEYSSLERWDLSDQQAVSITRGRIKSSGHGSRTTRRASTTWVSCAGGTDSCVRSVGATGPGGRPNCSGFVLSARSERR